MTSYDSATQNSGTVLSQVQMTFNGFGQLIKQAQSHSGVVGSSSPAVQYLYTEGSGGSNQSRLTATRYPGGRVKLRLYGTSGGMNDLLGRVQSIQDGTTPIANYTYLGL